ncbi:hypothetical protein GCM10023185_19040 [Hymenobacter saemangeumensis]|uniref:Uncharacterized protein n=1 Tax=Hymenobacter saemangeumensis TaxID=1084522 RepID=A0ABP8ICK0_9BACT
MKLGRKFSTLTYGEYLHLIENHQKFTDFNTLGLFRSIIETTKLNLEEKQELRRVAIAAFAKTFEFLQLKDPRTYFEVSTLGETLTKADEQQAWEDIKQNQQKILESKRISHRNFGTYSKHNCGLATCHLNGVMLRQGCDLAWNGPMHFQSDTYRWNKHIRPERRKTERKGMQHVIAQRLGEE